MLLTITPIIVVLTLATCGATPPVQTPLGQVRGYFKTSHSGRAFLAFEGIPYAKPPTGERRFRPPEPPEPWTGTWDASFLTQCVQTNMVQQTSIDGEEDCLYVNVYVPRLDPNPEERLDVIVHIHGGAFTYGSGHSYAHPEYLMDEDVIFVTFNYRLGMFGFLSTEDDVVPGNNGLKDQVMALEWVQKNIASFGGNPESVTLTGLSSGGSSVHLHFLSRMSEGLFHRGWSGSGGALNPYVLQEEGLARSRLLGEAVGCSGDDSEDLVQCLRQRNYKHLVTKMPLFFGIDFLPFVPFAPVVEKGPGFLDENPFELMVTRRVRDLPWMVSNVDHEGMMPVAFYHRDLKRIEDNWENAAHFFLDYNYTLPKSQRQNVAARIKKFYFGDDDISSNFPQLIRLFGDRVFLLDTEAAAKLQAKVNESPVYFYKFGYPGDHSLNQTASHGDDAQYIFSNMFQGRNVSPNELKMKDVMVKMLVSFAKTGKPAMEGVTWEPTGHEKLAYLKIDGFDAKAMKVDEDNENERFWKSLGLEENENLFKIRDEL